MNFYISNIKNNNFSNHVTFNNLHIYFNDKVIFEETSEFISLFTGILWSGNLDTIPNGQFYYIKIHKIKNYIEVITDFIEDFSVYYTVFDNYFAITNSLLHIKSTINNYWVRKYLKEANNSFGRAYFPELDNIPNLNNTNCTVLNNVFRIGAFTKAYFDFDGKYIKTSYYLDKNYFLNSFKLQYSFDEVKDRAKNILESNINKLDKNSLLLCSSGRDSLLLYSLNKNFKLISYVGDWWEREKIEKISDNHIILRYSKEEYLSNMLKGIETYTIPSKVFGLAIEISLLNNYSNDIIVTGSYGDEIFWHEHHALLTTFIFNYDYTYKQCLDFISKPYVSGHEHPIYNWNPFKISESLYNQIKKYSCFEEAITARFYYRESYLKDERVLSNKLLISPYIDLRLKTLLNSADRDTQERSCFDAEIQLSLISTSLYSKLNKFKAGAEEGSNLIPQHNEKIFKSFIKNYKGHHKEINL